MSFQATFKATRDIRWGETLRLAISHLGLFELLDSEGLPIAAGKYFRPMVDWALESGAKEVDTSVTWGMDR